MKSLILMLSLFVSVAAQAENFYRCDVKSQPKGPSYGYDLALYLSDSRESTHRVAQTELKLMVNPLTSEIEGTVNGQPNFILRGNVKDGAEFESAHAVGTIACQAVKLPVAFYKVKSAEIFVGKDKDTSLSLNYVEQLKSSCYISKDVLAVATVVRDLLVKGDMSLTLKGDDISVTRQERVCVESIGSYDNYECLRYSEPFSKTYTLRNCYQAPQDPR